MTERQLQTAIIDAAEQLGWLVYHVSNVKGLLRASTSPGYPDLTLVRAPRVIFAELKTRKGKLSMEQVWWLETLRGCPGVETYVWRVRDLDTAYETLR